MSKTIFNLILGIIVTTYMLVLPVQAVEDPVFDVQTVVENLQDEESSEGLDEKAFAVPFIGDYADAGSTVIPFMVVSELQKDEKIKNITGIELLPASSRYTGTAQHPDEIVHGGRWILKEGVDYTSGDSLVCNNYNPVKFFAGAVGVVISICAGVYLWFFYRFLHGMLTKCTNSKYE